MICVPYPTIMSGLVLRWFQDEAAFLRGEEIANTSRDYFWCADGCPEDVRRQADAAHSYLSVEYAAHHHPRLDVSRWATHTTSFPGRELVAVAPTHQEGSK